MEKGSNLVRERAARAWERHLSWVPTLYLLRGIPYVAILALVPIVLNRMGVTNATMLPWKTGSAARAVETIRGNSASGNLLSPA